ncbi:hypothetical protein BGZ75_009753, partial [Mortierella antarctica]
MAMLWTCAITLVYFTKLGLIAVHCNCAKRERVRGLETGVSQESAIVNCQSSNERLTPQLQTNDSWSEASKALELALSAVVRGHRPGNDETSTVAGDARFGMDEDVYEQHSNPASAMNLSEIAIKARIAGTTTTASSGPNRAFDQGTQVREFLRLQRKHRSLVQRIQALQFDQQRQQGRPSKQDPHALQQRLQEAHQCLQRLQVHYGQLQSMQAQSEEIVRWNPVQDLQQASTMSVLQQQLKFTLKQLDLQIEAC